MPDGRFAGVDWASEEHAVCVVDERGRIVEGRRYRRSKPGIRALCSRLVRLGVALVASSGPQPDPRGHTEAAQRPEAPAPNNTPPPPDP